MKIHFKVIRMESNKNQTKYTFPPIPSKKNTTKLPKGPALVLEGGGMRGSKLLWNTE